MTVIYGHFRPGRRNQCADVDKGIEDTIEAFLSEDDLWQIYMRVNEAAKKRMRTNEAVRHSGGFRIPSKPNIVR